MAFNFLLLDKARSTSKGKRVRFRIGGRRIFGSYQSCHRAKGAWKLNARCSTGKVTVLDF
jgi:hypothetical protein